MRSSRVSPMPTRMPVVNGTRARPAACKRGEPARRGLVGRAEVRAARLVQPVGERLDHHPLRRADGAQAQQLGLGERARVRVGEQAGLVERRARRPRRGSRPCSRSPCSREPFRRLRVPLLGRLAEREQRLEATERGAARRELQHLFLGEVRRVEPGRAAWRTCSSRSGRGTAS